jgi:hypothetical protein
MKTFKQDTLLLTITIWIEEELKKQNKIEFIVPNPDLTAEHIGYKAWVSLAELNYCKMLTPTVISKSEICLSFKKLNNHDSFHTDKIMHKEEKYGTESKFFNINKNEEPTFLYAYKKALESVKISQRKQILNLGINKADEFELIRNIVEENIFNSINFIGVDHSASALNFAKKRFNGKNMKFYKKDINKISELKLEKSDLIISIGTLQSPSINYKPFLMSLVQEHLTKDGAFILGFPNSRWIDSELIYGAKAPNYNYSEMSLLFNDVIFAKKYLQQKKFRVTITGREYIFLTATKISL